MNDSERKYKLREAEIVLIPQIREAIENEIGPNALEHSEGDIYDYYEDGYANEEVVLETLRKLLITSDDFLIEHPVLTEMRIEFATKCMELINTNQKSLLSARIMDVAEEMYYKGFMNLYDKMMEFNFVLRKKLDAVDPKETFPSSQTVSQAIKKLNQF